MNFPERRVRGMGDDLQGKSQEILDYIKQQQMEKGYPPSVREICEAVGLKSTSTVHGHLDRLEKKGYIRRDKTKPRAIEILDADSLQFSFKDLVHVPVLGRVTAGQPILAVENIEDTFPLPAQYLPNSDVFMLRVQGESMIGAGIFDGDQVIVKKQEYAENGDYVVALLEDEATIKTFYREKGYVRLQPENPSMEPIITRDVRILGKVIGLFRML
jgi:repressor LexA